MIYEENKSRAKVERGHSLIAQINVQFQFFGVR